jgi:hypothetical protein
VTPVHSPPPKTQPRFAPEAWRGGGRGGGPPPAPPRRGGGGGGGGGAGGGRARPPARPPARSAAVSFAVESGRAFRSFVLWSAALRAGGKDALSRPCEAPSPAERGRGIHRKDASLITLIRHKEPEKQ